MNDLDIKIRTLLETAVADAPEAPEVDDIGARAVRQCAPARTDRPRRLLVAAAAVLAVGVAATAVVNVTNRPSPQAQVVSPPQGLPTYVLPTRVPDGWELVDIVETAASSTPDGSFQSPSQLFRRTDGAAVLLMVMRHEFRAAVPTTAGSTTTEVSATTVLSATTIAGEASGSGSGPDQQQVAVAIAG